MRIIRVVVLLGTLAVFLYMVNTGIMGAEKLLAEGEKVYLELAPVDPRSLIQGDYMALDYAIERDARSAQIDEDVERGLLVVSVDSDGVAHFQSIYDGGELAPGEKLIQFRNFFGQIDIGVDSFFFQEGFAEYYDDAEYAEVRVTADGGVMLVDLVGENFETLVPGE